MLSAANHASGNGQAVFIYFCEYGIKINYRISEEVLKMENKKHKPGKMNILADPSIMTLFSDTVTVLSSGESVRLVFSQKLPIAELDTSGAPTHRIVSSIEVTVPFYMRMLERGTKTGGAEGGVTQGFKIPQELRKFRPAARVYGLNAGTPAREGV